MGYQTVRKVPNLRTYAEAENWHKMTKPIRGRDKDLRPLAERRYADCYSIRKNPENQAIECVLYQTPVVTFMPDGEIQVRTGGWATTSTHMFVREVLGYQIEAKGCRGKSMFTVNGEVFAIGGGEVMRLRRGDDGRYKVQDKQTHYDYRMNRKATNNVRQRYSAFREYFHGFIKLREQSVGNVPEPCVGCTIAEFIEVFGADDWEGAGVAYLHVNANKYNLIHKIGNRRTRYKESMAEFIGLITDESETKHESFYKASVILCGYEKRMTITKGVADMGSQQWVSSKHVRDLLNLILLKYHAEEVLERRELAPGKVPTSKYVSWVGEK